MIRSTLVLAAAGALLAACGSGEESTEAVEGPAVSTSEAPRNPAVDVEATSQETPMTPGANSFTEGQAREAIQKQGYSDVGPLTQNDAGIWSATASRDGTQTAVSVDYKGVVTTQ